MSHARAAATVLSTISAGGQPHYLCIDPQFFGGAHQLVTATIGSINVTYVQVWKVNTQGITENLRRLAEAHQNLSGPVRATFSFTFVREPLSHFVSGYSEIMSRHHIYARLYRECAPRCNYSSLRPDSSGKRTLLSPEAHAMAFVDDFVKGKLYAPSCCPHQAAISNNLHVLPQTSFLFSAFTAPGGNAGVQPAEPLQHIDRIYNLEDLDEDWASISRQVDHWGRYQHLPDYHRSSSAASGSVHRAAMERLLFGKSGGAPNSTLPSVHKLCKLLRWDSGCFGYPLQGVCARDAEDVAEYAPISSASHLESEHPCPLLRFNSRGQAYPSVGRHICAH